MLKKELENLNNNNSLDETGTVLAVGDEIARLYGLSNVESGETEFNDNESQQAIVLNLEEDNVGAVLLQVIK